MVSDLRDLKTPSRVEKARDAVKVYTGATFYRPEPEAGSEGRIVRQHFRVRVLDYGEVTFGADGTAFVSCVMEVPKELWDR